MNQSSGLQGKTALVTGGAKRIGGEICDALIAEGVNIVLHYRSSEVETRSRRPSSGVGLWMLQADFVQPHDIDTLIERAVALAGKLDILINNASIFPLETLDTLSFDSLMRNMQVNAWAPFVLSREYARVVGTGKIVNLLDSRLADYDWTHVGYFLSKHVLEVMTRMCALAFAPRIAVNAISPGLILPPPGKDEAHLRRMSDTVPLKRHGDPRDVSEAVIYLLKSKFLTGEVINVDGGRHLREYDGRPQFS